MNIVALLPMKGNSERVPNKNLKFFAGKPLYHRVIDVLLSSRYINQIIVNTDSENIIKDIKKKYTKNIIINIRPEEIIGNYVSMNKIIAHDISTADADLFVQTHSTNPLLSSETVDKAIERMLMFLKTSEYDSIFSVTKTQKRFYTKEAKPMNHDPLMLVTQHLEPIYEENSSFYIFSKQSFIKNNNRIGSKPFMYEIDKIESIDIDEPDDFIIAESLFKLLR